MISRMISRMIPVARQGLRSLSPFPRRFVPYGVLGSLVLAVALGIAHDPRALSTPGTMPGSMPGSVSTAPDSAAAQPHADQAMRTGSQVWRTTSMAPPPGATQTRDQAVRRASLVKPVGVVVVPGSAEKLYQDFLRIGYRIDEVRQGAHPVPRVFVASMPGDVRTLRSVDRRKDVFIKSMLPLILSVNEEILADRERLKRLFALERQGIALDPADRDWLEAKYSRYGVESGDRDRLLLRVDAIPPSIALAQAAEESGWGTSRFALEGRALFGQRTFAEGAGMVPEKAPDGGFLVKSFVELRDGVRSYAHNLNTHAAYRGFRERRQAMHREGIVDPLRLIETLTRYSERGTDYIDSLRVIIRVNDLRAFDKARLNPSIGPAQALTGI